MQLEKSRVSDMHYPIPTFRPILGSIGLLDIKLPQKDIDTDGLHDGRTDGHTENTCRYFFPKQKILKTNACEAYEYFFAVQECTLEIMLV